MRQPRSWPRPDRDLGSRPGPATPRCRKSALVLMDAPKTISAAFACRDDHRPADEQAVAVGDALTLRSPPRTRRLPVVEGRCLPRRGDRGYTEFDNTCEASGCVIRRDTMLTRSPSATGGRVVGAPPLRVWLRRYASSATASAITARARTPCPRSLLPAFDGGGGMVSLAVVKTNGSLWSRAQPYGQLGNARRIMPVALRSGVECCRNPAVMSILCF
jgi:hypothetical protein